nr:hypothetical protein [Tanacetum cinerariifolium]
HNANDGRHDSGLVGEQEHGREPDAAHHERLTKPCEAGNAGQLNKQLGDTGKIPEEDEQPDQAGPVKTLRSRPSRRAGVRTGLDDSDRQTAHRGAGVW